MANPFVHIELNTDDVAAAKKFYKRVFDWKLQDPPGMHYTMIDVGKGVGGGMMEKPMHDAPTMWLPYVEVDSVQATIAKARKAGADVKVAHMPLGGNMGAIGVFVDPTGAGIGVWEKPKAAPKRAAKKSAKKKSAKTAAVKKSAKKGAVKKGAKKKR